MKSESKYKSFHSPKMHLKISSANMAAISSRGRGVKVLPRGVICELCWVSYTLSLLCIYHHISSIPRSCLVCSYNMNPLILVRRQTIIWTSSLNPGNFWNKFQYTCMYVCTVWTYMLMWMTLLCAWMHFTEIFISSINITVFMLWPMKF